MNIKSHEQPLISTLNTIEEKRAYNVKHKRTMYDGGI